jgi:hypothetical protein
MTTRPSAQTPERIWLLLHEGDEGSHVWCDDPDPSGNGETESVGYVRDDVALVEQKLYALDCRQIALCEVRAVASLKGNVDLMNMIQSLIDETVKRMEAAKAAQQPLAPT